MVKDSIDVLGLLRKRGMEGDVDFLREALAVLRQDAPSDGAAACELFTGALAGFS